MAPFPFLRERYREGTPRALNGERCHRSTLTKSANLSTKNESLHGDLFMPIHPRRPRFGRLLDVLVVSILFAVFAGLGVYHFRRLDGLQVNPERRKHSTSQQ